MKSRAERGYLIGGLQIAVKAPEFADSARLAAFRNDSPSCDAELILRLADSVSEPNLPLLRKIGTEKHYSDGRKRAFTVDDGEGSILLKVLSEENRISAELASKHADYLSSHVIMLALELPRLMLNSGGVFLHASFIKRGDRAILFTADKQVGKSTQAALWEKHMGADVINGDRALLRRKNGVWTAFGSPYCGSSGICKNDYAAIAAVVILGQAETTSIRRATNKEALAALLSGASYDASDREECQRCLDICGDLIDEIPFFKLDCTPDLSAVEALAQAMTEI